MESVLAAFKAAYLSGNGVQLSYTLFPLTSPEQPARLLDIARSTNAEKITNDIRYSILYDSSSVLKLSNDEARGWVDVYVAYWKTVCQIVKAEEAMKSNLSVRTIVSIVTWRLLAFPPTQKCLLHEASPLGTALTVL